MLSILFSVSAFTGPPLRYSKIAPLMQLGSPPSPVVAYTAYGCERCGMDDGCMCFFDAGRVLEHKAEYGCERCGMEGGCMCFFQSAPSFQAFNDGTSAGP